MLLERTLEKPFVEIPKFKEKRQEIERRRREGTIRYVVIAGGRGSGKSKEVAEIITRFLFGYRDRIFCLRKHEAQNRRSIYTEIVEHLRTHRADVKIPRNAYNVGKSPKLITTRNRKGRRGVIEFAGLAFADRMKSTFKPDVSVLEEASEFTYEDFLTYEQSVRHEGAIIILVCNPPHEGEDSWIYQHFIGDNASGEVKDLTLYFHTDYRDNPYLDKNAVITYKALKKTNPYEYERSILGLWVKNQESLVFPIFEIHKGQFTPPRNAVITQGLDFGYTNPTCLLRVYTYRDQNEEEVIFVASEKYKSGLNTSSMVEYLSDQQFVKTYPTFCDSEDPSRIDDLRQSGFNVVTAQKPQGSVMAGINYIKTRRLVVHESCVNLIRELKNYSWKKNPNGGFFYGKIADNCEDHGIDSLRYSQNNWIMRDYSKASVLSFGRTR